MHIYQEEDDIRYLENIESPVTPDSTAPSGQFSISPHMSAPSSPPLNLSLVTSPQTTPRPQNPRVRYFSQTIDLLRGHPSTTLLPSSEIYGAISIALHTPALLPSDSYAESRHPLHYGPDMGNLNFRVELGRWVGEKFHTPAINPDRICLTSGASNGLAAVLTSCTSPGTGYTRMAFVVSPTYFLAARIFEDAGFANKLTAIKQTSKSTIDLDGLEEHLKNLDAISPAISLADALRPILREGVPPFTKRIYKYVLYGVPTYSNPTGETLDLPTRKRLLSLARTHDMLIVTDDVYDFLGNTDDTSARGADGHLLPRFVTLEHAIIPPPTLYQDAGHTVSNCSFSKILGPGLRAGWIETASPVLARQIGEGGANHSGGAPCHFVASMLLPLLLPHSPQLLHRKIDMVIARLSAAYTENCTAARAAVERFLPEGTEVWGGNGGFFMWLVLPEGINAAEVCRLAALKEHVIVASGGMSECPGKKNEIGWGQCAVRIAVSYCVSEEIEEGLRRFGSAVARWKAGERCNPAAEVVVPVP